MGEFKTQTPIQYIKGVGPKLAKPLQKLGINTAEEAVFFIPRDYEDRRVLVPLSQIQTGQIALIEGQISKLIEKKTKTNTSIIQAYLKTNSGYIIATWFNQKYLLKVLKMEQWLLVKGKVEESPFEQYRTLLVSETEYINPENPISYKGSIFPVYSLTDGMYQSKLRQILKSCLERVQRVSDPLPKYLTQNFKEKLEAIKAVHYPDSIEDLEKAKERLSFEELFLYQLRILKTRGKKEEVKTSPLNTEGEYRKQYESNLPYVFTNAQKKAIEDIAQDVSRDIPMNRLLQGDVGAGKTDVAMVSLLMAIDSNKTGALMAPTEVLASQLYYKLTRLLGPLGIEINLLKGKMKAQEKRDVLKKLEENKAQIIIGTHALIEDDVLMPHLGLVVIDEQHRFGVVQRLKLSQKASSPHCLYMTATPIPRTFTLTCFGDLDHSTMTELPKGRIPIQTFFIKTQSLEKVLAACEERLKEGEQVYVVYPLVEESEKLDLKSAIEGYEYLKQRYSNFSVGLIHGKLPPVEKEAIMDAFKKKETQILVATTVIEVGIDVPNATCIVINHAERFGLSQLHQLRGRVGRGNMPSFCYLVGDPKTESGKKRIAAMKSTTDGFQLAEYDMLIRGPGDMLGTKQAGLPEFKVADLLRDDMLLKKARKEAEVILQKDPQLTAYPELKLAIEKQRSSVESVNLN